MRLSMTVRSAQLGTGIATRIVLYNAVGGDQERFERYGEVARQLQR